MSKSENLRLAQEFLGRMLAIYGCLLAVALFAGCASTEVTSSQPLVNERLPRPNYIWVYDFVATPADVPRGSSFADPSYRPAQPQTPEEISAGRQAGAEVAATLVERIRDMGLPAERPSPRTPPQTNDMVIWGYFISLDEGSAVQRIAIGFGSGSSQLTTAVEVYQMTATGLRKLGWAKVDASGNKAPGVGLGGGELYNHRQSREAHRRQRDESLWGGERSHRGDRPGQGDGQGHRTGAQTPVRARGLDSALSVLSQAG